MERSEGANLAVGALLIGIGAVILGLLAPVAAAVVAGVCAFVGAYLIVGGVYLGWPSFTTAAERVFRPRLVNASSRLVQTDRGIVFELAALNEGRDDLIDANLNVVVPTFVTKLDRCSAHGQVGLPEHKGAFFPGRQEGFWHGTVTFPGRMTRIVYFRAEMEPVRDFWVRWKVIAPVLNPTLEETFCLTPLAEPLPPGQAPETGEQGS